MGSGLYIQPEGMKGFMGVKAGEFFLRDITLDIVYRISHADI